jgi:hypothetical protein
VTVSLLYEAGVDYRTVLFWEQTWLTEAEERVTGETPPQVAVETIIDDEHLLFTVDGTHTVTDHRRDDTT